MQWIVVKKQKCKIIFVRIDHLKTVFIASKKSSCSDIQALGV